MIAIDDFHVLHHRYYEPDRREDKSASSTCATYLGRIENIVSVVVARCTLTSACPQRKFIGPTFVVLAQSSSSGDVIYDRAVKVPVSSYTWAEYRLQLAKYWRSKGLQCKKWE
jgi:hypothetical protein